ncbi:MAG TPA: DNA primase noncatalytic subunit PriX [Nitrososphaeraceae archaeon]
MYKAYESANFVDCRVNAFPSYTEYKGIQRYPPNFVFADLDASSFENSMLLRKSLDDTLRTIRLKINGSPTVLWTGNGYHVYQPIDAVILEELSQFEQFENPSSKFLRFVERYLTNEKSDPAHNPSFKSCMLRIPGSTNSKCELRNNTVEIIQKWDGYRPPISLLFESFHSYLIDQKYNELKLQKRLQKRYGFNAGEPNNSVHWIEILLETPIDDYRKNTVGLILAPYLINIRGLPYDAAYEKIKDWLEKCNNKRHLDSNFDRLIKMALLIAIKKQRLPMKLATLGNKNNNLHLLLKKKLSKKSG